MALSNELISQFAKITRDEKDTKKEMTVYGTVVEYGGSNYVRFDGSDLLTPVSTTVDAKPGERVTVMLKNHTAIVTGNISSPAARTGDVQEVDDKVIQAETLLADTVRTDTLEAVKATISSLQANDIIVNERLDATSANIDEIEANYLKVNERIDALVIEAGSIDVDFLNANYASLVEFAATKGRVDTLVSDVADIDTLIFGSASGDVVQTSFANTVIAQLGDAQIKSAMIESISASKIMAGSIVTNAVRVRSENGRLLISDDTLQISDGDYVRVQIGKDATNDYSINVWDSEGKLMFSQGGITDYAIKSAIIRNDMISDTANISAHKLDISSLFEEINGSANTIKSSKIYLDDKAQTLDVAFTSLTTDVNDLGDTVSSQGTQISAVQGQLTSKIWQQDINTAKNELSGTINTLSTQYSTLNQTVDSFKTTVSDTYATKTALNTTNTNLTSVTARVTSAESNLTQLSNKITANVTETDELGTRMSTVEQTASGLTTRLTTVETGVANSAKTATDYLNLSSAGLVVGQSPSNPTAGNVLLAADGLSIRKGTSSLAQFKATTRTATGITSAKITSSNVTDPDSDSTTNVSGTITKGGSRANVYISTDGNPVYFNNGLETDKVLINNTSGIIANCNIVLDGSVVDNSGEGIFTPLNSYGNTVIGYGRFQDGGGTHIYGGLVKAKTVTGFSATVNGSPAIDTNNSQGNATFGWHLYDSNKGETNVYGKIVSLFSKDDIRINANENVIRVNGDMVPYKTAAFNIGAPTLAMNNMYISITNTSSYHGIRFANASGTTYNAVGVNATGYPVFGNTTYATNLISKSTTTTDTGYSFKITCGDNPELTLADNDARLFLFGGTDTTSRYIGSCTAYKRTYTTSANMVITENSIIGRATSSSRRYKKDIVNLDIGVVERLYDMPLYQFKYISEYIADTDERYEKDIPGIIVEELDEYMPIACDHIRDENGELIPEMWNSNVLIPSLLKLIQDLNNRVKTLESRGA